MHWMDNWHMGWGMWIWLIVLIAVTWFVVWAVMKNRSGGRNDLAAPPEESALNILEKRYAKGEIDEEEFKRKKRELLS